MINQAAWAIVYWRQPAIHDLIDLTESFDDRSLICHRGKKRNSALGTTEHFIMEVMDNLLHCLVAGHVGISSISITHRLA